MVLCWGDGAFPGRVGGVDDREGDAPVGGPLGGLSWGWGGPLGGGGPGVGDPAVSRVAGVDVGGGAGDLEGDGADEAPLLFVDGPGGPPG